MEQFKKLHPDIVTMDIVMPRRSGIDAVKGILEVDPSARVVMCSALGQETLVLEALQAGARDFIVKPFKPDGVTATLRRCSRRRTSGAAARGPRQVPRALPRGGDDHLAEMSGALLALEKEPAAREAIDSCFGWPIRSRAWRPHSTTTRSRRSPTRSKTACRRSARGSRAARAASCRCCFRGLEGLERMLAVVRDTARAAAGPSPRSRAR